jgi:hypothetical protein
VFTVAHRHPVRFPPPGLHGVVELAMLQAYELQPDLAELLGDANTAKLGLALSAFGTIICGWGEYLGWWSFAYVLLWAAFVVRKRSISHTPAKWQA